MNTDFKLDTSGLDFDGLDDKISAGIMMYGKAAAAKFEAAAKENAPWTDRTGAARQRLKADFTEVPIGWCLSISHGVNYGVYLELAHERKYAILMPTILKLCNSFVDALRSMLRSKGG